MAIPKSSAYTILSLSDICPGDPITINYALDGSYFDDKKCGCASCNPYSPPVAKKRAREPAEFIPTKNANKTRRGGKRLKRKRTTRDVVSTDVEK